MLYSNKLKRFTGVVLFPLQSELGARSLTFGDPGSNWSKSHKEARIAQGVKTITAELHLSNIEPHLIPVRENYRAPLYRTSNRTGPQSSLNCCKPLISR